MGQEFFGVFLTQLESLHFLARVLHAHKTPERHRLRGVPLGLEVQKLFSQKMERYPYTKSP